MLIWKWRTIKRKQKLLFISSVVSSFQGSEDLLNCTRRACNNDRMEEHDEDDDLGVVCCFLLLVVYFFVVGHVSSVSAFLLSRVESERVSSTSLA